jgi:hypothetical protein
MMYFAFSFPAVVVATLPRGRVPIRWHSSWISGPPRRWIAPDTPLPRMKSLFAELTIASTSSWVMSPCRSWILRGMERAI